MIEYRKVMNRSLSLLAIEYWERGEREEGYKLFDGLFFAEPIFVSVPGKGVGVYYNWTDPRQDPMGLVGHFHTNPEIFFEATRKFSDQCKNILDVANRKNVEDFEELVAMLTVMWPMAGIVKMLGAWDRSELNAEIKQRCFDLRSATDTVFYIADAALRDMAESIVGESRKDDLDVLRLDEIVSRSFPSDEVIEERKRGFIFYRGELFLSENFGAFLRSRGIETVASDIENSSEMHGQPASSGMYRGRACVIFERSQFAKMNSGDVLVTSMTTPDFLPVMRLAGALVTDEGGITCHAAIVSREMGKPCVIGTKIATKVLRDGNIVEVDATQGIVRIIS